MKTPVLIPAYNEASHLARTLYHLPADIVDPIVLLNGTEDDSRQIVDDFGVKFRDFEARGKLPAIQSTLKSLGKEALESILLLDADTRPIFPKRWHDVMVRVLTNKPVPTYVSAPVLFTPRREGGFGEHVLLSLFRYGDGVLRDEGEVEKGHAAFYGLNQGFKLQTIEVLDTILDMPHYWPMEDVAMAHEIVRHNGVMRQSSDIRAAVLSPVSQAMPPLRDWATKNSTQIIAEITNRYRIGAAEGSVPYENTPRNGQLD